MKWELSLKSHISDLDHRPWCIQLLLVGGGNQDIANCRCWCTSKSSALRVVMRTALLLFYAAAVSTKMASAMQKVLRRFETAAILPHGGGRIAMRCLASESEATETLGLPDRSSHTIFFRERDWSRVEDYWTSVVGSQGSSSPPYILGDSEYGVTNMTALHEAGARSEFSHNDPRYQKRHTFALRIGYVGTKYNGFQRQKGVPGVHTVEDDIKIALGYKTYCAGRTDAGVSAVSQVINFKTVKEDVTTWTADMFIRRMQESEPCKAGRLRVYDCQRVPKKFNARSMATWRRYLYLVPLNTGSCDGGYDVDVKFVNAVLNRLVDKELPYNGLAYGEDRNVGNGLKDLCTMYRARAFVIDMANISQELPSDEDVNATNTDTADKDKASSISDAAGRHKQEGEEITLRDSNTGGTSDDILSSRSNTDDSDDDRDRIDTSREIETPAVAIAVAAKEQQQQQPAICIELVGSRFLRKMVRIIAATATREGVLPEEQRNENILVDICHSKDRSLAANPLPGHALCFAGVGFDALDLALYEFMPKVKRLVVEAEIKARDEAMGAVAHKPVEDDESI